MLIGREGEGNELSSRAGVGQELDALSLGSVPAEVYYAKGIARLKKSLLEFEKAAIELDIVGDVVDSRFVDIQEAAAEADKLLESFISGNTESGKKLNEILAYNSEPAKEFTIIKHPEICLLYTSPSPRDRG